MQGGGWEEYLPSDYCVFSGRESTCQRGVLNRGRGEAKYNPVNRKKEVIRPGKNSVTIKKNLWQGANQRGEKK